MPDTARDLLADARAGDPDALGRLLESYRRYLRLLADVEVGRRLRGKVDASDVVQEAFLAAHRQFAGFRGESAAQLAAWLREILAGTLANQVRRYFGTQARDARLERGLADDLGRSSAALGAVPVDPHSSPSEQAARGEQAVRLADALALLPADHRAVIVFRHLDGLTFPEIADRMGRSVDSVEKLWVRGLGRLRAAFRGEP